MNKKVINGITFGVFIYVFSYMLLVLMYCSPRIFAEFASVDFLSGINENFEFPLSVFSWGLITICSGYSCIDLGVGKDIEGDIVRKRVILVIILLGVIFLECCLLNYFLGHELMIITKYGKQIFKGVDIPLELIGSALVSASTVYITGGSIKELKNKED